MCKRELYRHWIDQTVVEEFLSLDKAKARS